MSFDTLLGPPWLIRVEPAGTTHAHIGPTGRGFDAEADLEFAGSETNAATLGSSLVITTGGENSIRATFKFGINSFHTDAVVIPGPGFVLTEVGVDFSAFRIFTPPSGGPPMMDSFQETLILSSSVAPLSWPAFGGGGQFFNHDFTFPLNRPTAIGELWQFMMSAFATAEGGGFIAAGSARLTGLLHFIRVRGT